MLLSICASSAGFVVLVLISVAFFLYRRRIHQRKQRPQCSAWLSFPSQWGISIQKFPLAVMIIPQHTLVCAAF
ncbi:hypothetical protein ACFX2I_001200 [Malus domestica]